MRSFSTGAFPGGGRGLPMQFVIQTTDPFRQLNEVSQNLWKRQKKRVSLFI